MRNILSSLFLLSIVAACATEVPNHGETIVAQEPTNEDLTGGKIEPKTLFEGKDVPSLEELMAAGNFKEIIGEITIPKPQKMRTDNLTLVGLGVPVPFTELQKYMNLAGLEVANPYEAVWYANVHPGYVSIQHDRNYIVFHPLLVIEAAADGGLILNASGEHEEIFPAGQSVLIHIPDGVDFGHGGS